MTALNIATDIPTSINSLEKLLVWAHAAAAYIQNGSTYKELRGNAVDDGTAPFIDVSIIAAHDKSTRQIGRVSVEIDPDYVAAEFPIWDYAREWNTNALPAMFKP